MALRLRQTDRHSPQGPFHHTHQAPGWTYSCPGKGPRQQLFRGLSGAVLDFRLRPHCDDLSPGYVLQHSAIDRIPIWVAEHVGKGQLTGSLERDNAFAPDPLLPSGKRAELKDYKGSGYDRGHQAPAGNQTNDATTKSETFFLSNMCPQLGKLNRQKWKELEEKTRVWVKTFGDAYEITGPIFYDPKEDNPATADGMVTFKQIGPDKVSVPTHFFKVVIAKNGGKAAGNRLRDGKPRLSEDFRPCEGNPVAPLDRGTHRP